ncbi:hypothetical protein FHS42_005642 [Streptomyces zagrosensis]|uniref:Uncharacterized protein n=1 Tax=Streptomyces zagrosensis TaxID=1042984 RepID=A0A7W9V0T1_9ACTN|nr:hypothetical protein [Streptomyces zagrosensis]
MAVAARTVDLALMTGGGLDAGWTDAVLYPTPNRGRARCPARMWALYAPPFWPHDSEGPPACAPRSPLS